jgi:hypothetical protein
MIPLLTCEKSYLINLDNTYWEVEKCLITSSLHFLENGIVKIKIANLKLSGRYKMISIGCVEINTGRDTVSVKIDNGSLNLYGRKYHISESNFQQNNR